MHSSRGPIVSYAAIVRQRHGKHVSAATNECTTVEELLEAVSSVWSMLRLHNEDHLDKPVSLRSESAVSSHELQVSAGSSWLAVRNLRCQQLLLNII
jgi:hypothetical protein